MTFTLTPKQERLIKAISERKRKPIEVVINDLLTAEQFDEMETQDLETWQETFQRWEERFRGRQLPDLPLEAFSRESLYGER